MRLSCYYTAEIREFFQRVLCGFVYINVLLHGRCRVQLEHHFFKVILRPNFDDALENASTILWISSSGWAIRRCIFVVFVFALKCKTVKGLNSGMIGYILRPPCL